MKRIAWGTALAVAVVAGSPATAQEKPGFKDTPTLPGGKWKVHDADHGPFAHSVVRLEVHSGMALSTTSRPGACGCGWPAAPTAS